MNLCVNTVGVFVCFVFLLVVAGKFLDCVMLSWQLPQMLQVP